MTIQDSTEPNFEGLPGSTCEHRTVGYRAWCHSCTTWCYPSDPCPRCELTRQAAEQVPTNSLAVLVIADQLDRPSVYMGGPSAPSRRRAREIVEALGRHGIRLVLDEPVTPNAVPHDQSGTEREG